MKINPKPMHCLTLLLLTKSYHSNLRTIKKERTAADCPFFLQK